MSWESEEIVDHEWLLIRWRDMVPSLVDLVEDISQRARQLPELSFLSAITILVNSIEHLVSLQDNGRTVLVPSSSLSLDDITSLRMTFIHFSFDSGVNLLFF